MIVTFFRSSSFTAWDMCPHSFTLNYVIGKKALSNKKAIIGNIVHKALELLARKKVAIQNSEMRLKDDELERSWTIKEMTPDLALNIAFAYYSKKESHLDWKPADQKQSRVWMWDALLLNKGMWNPLNRNILAPEQYFDYVIEKPWAEYEYVLPDGKRLRGHLGLKGTIDLVTQASPGVVEYLDWKSGKRLDWATGQVKDWKKLRKDPQLRIYHWALKKLYPDAKQIIMTIVFIRDGGAFSLPFEDSDLEETEKMLKKRFNLIRNTNIASQRKSWRCTAFCYYGKNNYFDEQKRDTGVTLCDHYHKEIVTLGMDRVMKKYSDGSSFASYGDGGGRSDREIG